MAPLADELRDKLMTLDEALWERRISGGRLDRWLSNFDGAADPAKARLHALYLASEFLYFGDREIRALLIALYRDLYRYPILAELRRTSNLKPGSDELGNLFATALANTRFLPLGNPSESSSLLLYYFRQENGLDKRLFVNAHELLKGLATGAPQLSFPSVRRYVYIDDFCGSGTQVKRYSREVIQALRAAASAASSSIRIDYFPVVASSHGVAAVKKAGLFDRVEAVVELDQSYRCFCPTARQFVGAPSEIDKAYAEELCRQFGRDLMRGQPLGYRPGQLMLGFHHNTPNNTLPIFWCESNGPRRWRPLFRRYSKMEPQGPRDADKR